MLPADARFLIVQPGSPVEPLGRRGGFARWIRTAAGLRAQQVQVVDVQAGQPLPAHARFAGVLVTGSAAMVSQRLDWSERAADWLRDAAGAGRPVLGICYGHQLLAHALGGRVGPNPNGREIGTVAVELLPQAAGDPLFATMPATFPAHATHQESVLALPPGAVRLAASRLDGCQAFRCGQAAWGVQFHPEFRAIHMRGYLRARAAQLWREQLDPEALLAAVRPTPQARALLQRFVRLAC